MCGAVPALYKSLNIKTLKKKNPYSSSNSRSACKGLGMKPGVGSAGAWLGRGWWRAGVGWFSSLVPCASPVAFLDNIDAVAEGGGCLCALESPQVLASPRG